VNDEEREPTDDAGVNALGVGIALGAGLGSVLFAITDFPGWIGIGAGIGVAIGAAVQQQRR
jgi:acid phosphatase family membrane protein YuiD